MLRNILQTQTADNEVVQTASNDIAKSIFNGHNFSCKVYEISTNKKATQYVTIVSIKKTKSNTLS